MKNLKTEYLVIGAGLAGSGIALELARQGKKMLMLEQDQLPMNRASLRNEGKIHLGLIYAADRTGATGIQQLKGSLEFHRIIKSWIGDRIHEIEISNPSIYLVANDSLLNPETLENHYNQLEKEYFKIIANNEGLDYLGMKLKWLTQPLSLKSLDNVFKINSFQAAFETNERAINTDDLAREIRHALVLSDNINLITGAKVVRIEEHQNTYKVIAELNDSRELLTIEALTVFNASWDQRLKLDAFAGILPKPGWVHRLKYRVITSLETNHQNLPSATIVLGAYGDVVIRKNSVYMSWYPSGMKGWSHDHSPPFEWYALSCDNVKDLNSLEVARSTLANIKAWYPCLKNSEMINVDAGTIFAYGKTDVDHRESQLHERTSIGIHRKNNFFSIDPGKLTTAPMFSVEAVRQALSSQ